VTPAELDQAARAHVAHAVADYPASPYDPDVWVAAVRAHLTPLPADRPWLRRRARHLLQPVGVTAPAVVERVRRSQVTPASPCPHWCAQRHAGEAVA
jgi:hypothetical protein